MSNSDRTPLLPTRKVLFLNQCNNRFDWDDEFHAIDWQAVCAWDTEQARQLLIKDRIDVAIVAIPSRDQQQACAGISRLIQGFKNVIWLALSCDNHFSDNTQLPVSPALFFDYHHLPIDWQKMAHTLGHAQGMAVMRNKRHCEENRQALQKDIMRGQAPVMQELKAVMHKVAVSDAAVFISGETGSGKGLCAEWIHQHSARAGGPFIIVNSAALPNNLIHSELFGFEKGAFTGAQKRHIGYLERADKGTLFLDEIGDLSLESQINLLRFLEDNTLERLGGDRRITVDCRLLFATHVDIEQAVDKGLFREDLYHRINIVQIHIPPLRERREDIQMLADTFLDQYSQAAATFTFTPQAIEAMLRYNWPGNVRELKNRIQRAVVLCDTGCISEPDLGLKPIDTLPAGNIRKRTQQDLDTEALLTAIRNNNNNISAAARELKISRTTFYKLVKKCRIKL